jgi:uncharacterized protein (DUF983 family)
MSTDDPRQIDATGKIWPRLEPVQTGVRGRCPRCGQGHIFAGFLRMRESCEVCGLDYSYADPADGPAIFVQLFACVPGVLFALLFEVFYSPPMWMHFAFSLPIVLAFTVLPSRPIKGWLVASQFYFKAGEGRLAQP